MVSGFGEERPTVSVLLLVSRLVIDLESTKSSPTVFEFFRDAASFGSIRSLRIVSRRP
jgi:hypothetical protein